MRNRWVFESVVRVCTRSSLLIMATISIGMFVEKGYGQVCDVSTPLHLIDRHGQPVTNITRDQLRVKVDGTPVSVSSIASVAKPGVVVLLDVSPSMKKTWKQSIAAARQLIDEVGANEVLFAFDMGISAYAVGRAKKRGFVRSSLTARGAESAWGNGTI